MKKTRSLPALLIFWSLCHLALSQEPQKKAQAKTPPDKKGTESKPPDKKANVVISNGPIYEFGRILIGEGSSFKFRITNIGTLDADDLKPGQPLINPFSYTGGKYPGTAGNCGNALKTSDHCIIEVSFTPMMAGEFNGTLNLEYFNQHAITTSSRPIRAVAVGPALLHLKEVGHFNFGDRIIGAPPSSQAFIVANVGGVVADKLDIPDVEKPFSIDEGNCRKQLQPSESCKLDISFNPKVSSQWKQNLKLGYFDGRKPQILYWEIQGRGMTPSALVAVGESSHDYETEVIGNTRDHTFSLKNTGEVAATSLKQVFEEGEEASSYQYKGTQYPGQGGTCGELIGGGETCNIVLTFIPKASGSFKTTFRIQYATGLTNRQIEMGLRGKAVTPAHLAFVEGTHFDFGEKIVGEVTDHTLYLTNLGQAPVQNLKLAPLTTPLAFKGGDYPGLKGSCTATLPSGDKCKLHFALSPNASGTAKVPLGFTYSDGTKTQNLLKEVTSLSKTRAKLSFIGNPVLTPVLAGQGTKVSFELANSGELDAEKIDFDKLTDPFSFSGGNFPGLGGDCLERLQAGGKCRVHLDFGPRFAGFYHSVLATEYHDGVNEVFLSQRLTASSVTKARIAITGGANFDLQKVGNFSVRQFKVTNAGHMQAARIRASSLDDDYSYEGGKYPGSSGTCKEVVGPGETCLISIAFFPNKPGHHAATVSLSYHDGTENQDAHLSLSAFACPGTRGKEPARLIASECGGN